MLITTSGVYLRGMNRSRVVIDGTKPGSPQCSSNAGDQSFGPNGSGGPRGLNGIMVWKANNVWVQNLDGLQLPDRLRRRLAMASGGTVATAAA